MMLRNKKTGQLGNFIINKDHFECVDLDYVLEYRNLAELNEEWEDVLEEEVWYLGEEIGNYTLPKEEARKITKKILAWKRLKDKGFKFSDYHIPAGEIHFDMEIPKDSLEEIAKDMGVCFGGEE